MSYSCQKYFRGASEIKVYWDGPKKSKPTAAELAIVQREIPDALSRLSGVGMGWSMGTSETSQNVPLGDLFWDRVRLYRY